MKVSRTVIIGGVVFATLLGAGLFYAMREGDAPKGAQAAEPAGSAESTTAGEGPGHGSGASDTVAIRGAGRGTPGVERPVRPSKHRGARALPPSAGGAGTAAAHGPGTPCTSSPCEPGSVPCKGQSGGVCTRTEAMLVQHDLDLAQATGKQGPSCYSCLQDKLILDNPSQGLANQECQDLPNVLNPITDKPNTEADVQHCLDLVDCLLSASAQPDAGPGSPGCGAVQPNLCYCGTSDVLTDCQTGAANGVCLPEYIAAANGASPQQIVDNLGNTTSPWGNATNLVIHSGLVGCPSCLQIGP